jgi:very-short-patch-repair endonuclease
MNSKKKIGYLKYNKSHKGFSRYLRNNSTLGEILLWNQLKAGRMMGYKFNRQKPLGNFIVDFYCKKLNLVIEVDGYSHNDKYEKDIDREKKLIKMGLHVLRFTEQQCRKQMINVVRAIEKWIEENTNTNPPAPPLQGGDNIQ